MVVVCLWAAGRNSELKATANCNHNTQRTAVESFIKLIWSDSWLNYTLWQVHLDSSICNNIKIKNATNETVLNNRQVDRSPQVADGLGSPWSTTVTVPNKMND